MWDIINFKKSKCPFVQGQPTHFVEDAYIEYTNVSDLSKYYALDGRLFKLVAESGSIYYRLSKILIFSFIEDGPFNIGEEYVRVDT